MFIAFYLKAKFLATKINIFTLWKNISRLNTKEKSNVNRVKIKTEEIKNLYVVKISKLFKTTLLTIV